MMHWSQEEPRLRGPQRRAGLILPALMKQKAGVHRGHENGGKLHPLEEGNWQRQSLGTALQGGRLRAPVLMASDTLSLCTESAAPQLGESRTGGAHGSYRHYDG